MDPFTLASPTYRNAARTCQKTGPALQMFPARTVFNAIVPSALAFASLLALACLAIGFWGAVHG